MSPCTCAAGGKSATRANEVGQIADPVAVGPQQHVSRPSGPHGLGGGAPECGGGRRRRRCGRRRSGADLALPTRLGVDQYEMADRGQFQLARVEHLDHDDVVARGQPAERPLPGMRPLDLAGRVQQVGHDDPQARPAVPSSQHRDRLGQAERGCAVPGVGGLRTLVGRRSARPAGGPRSARTYRVQPDRAGCRACRSAVRRHPATVVARSAFSAAAVPKAMLGLWSSSNQVSSSCSARVSHTCGSRARAVTFQSIRRTSWPGV